MSRSAPCSLIAIALFAAGLAECGNGVAPDTAVATMRGQTIYYRQIRCSSRNRAEPARCLAIEQSNLQRRIYGHALDTAAEALGIALTEDDRRQIDAAVSREHPHNVRAAERMRAMLKGAIRIHKGERLEAVQKELAPAGVSGPEMAEMTSRFPTVPDAEEALSIDFVGTADRSVRDFHRHAILTPRVAAAVAARAQAEGISVDDAEADLWRSVT
ncbi:MAG TPA: hypothetical protein VND45_03940, partial [Thermoanaerobaculia bacterium]|nr:hypothetical protein [Thermoanaerobaculia bacterium]